MASNRLVGSELIEYYKNRDEDNEDTQQLAERAGYTFFRTFESMLLRALGKFPLPIAKDQDGNEWREVTLSLCSLVPLEIRFEQISNSDNYQAAEAAEKVINNIRSSLIKSISKSCEYEKAFAHMVLRRYTYAFFAAQIDGLYTEERFESIYNGGYWDFINDIVSESVTDEEIESNALIIKNLQPYIRMIAQIFTNYFVNLTGNTQVEVLPEDHEYFIEWKNIHNKLENDGYYDELFVIRHQLIDAFIALEGSMVMDDEARNIFSAKACNLLDKYNSKGRMQVDIAEEKTTGDDLLEAIFLHEESGSTIISEVMNSCGYDHTSDEDTKKFWQERKAVEERFYSLAEKLMESPLGLDRLTGVELIERYKACTAIAMPNFIAAVACGYYEKTPSGKINVFISKMFDALDKAGYDGFSKENWELWLKEAPSQPLTGNALLDRISSLGDISKTELMVRCGYYEKVVTDNGNSYRATFTEFYEALLYAQGVKLSESKQKEPIETVDNDVNEFANSIARVMRRIVLSNWYGVEEYSTKDESTYQRSLHNAKEHLSRLGCHHYGIQCLSLIKQVVIRIFAYDGPADQHIKSRLDQLNNKFDQLVEESNIFNNESLDEVADRVMSDTTEYSKGVAHSLVAVLRTDVYNKFHDADYRLVESYHEDVKYISEQLAFLERGNCPAQFKAIVDSSLAGICMNPCHDQFDINEVSKWTSERVFELKEQYPLDQKAEGRYGGWI